jgi:hypothetical protein
VEQPELESLGHDILSHNWGPGRRAAPFFVSLFIIFANSIGRMGENMILFGADAMTLFPRFLNIWRGCGSYICLDYAFARGTFSPTRPAF